MAPAWAGRALRAFPAEVVVRRRTCAVDDARTAVVVVAVVAGAATIRSVAPLVQHLSKTDKLEYRAGLSNRQQADIKTSIEGADWARR